MVNRINVSKDENYHSQINNAEVPLASCQTTAMVMALKDCGIAWHYPGWMQPEDYLTILLRSNLARQELRRVDRYAYDTGLAPAEVHAMLSLYVNRMVEREVTRFLEHGTWADLLQEIHAGRPVVVSTTLTAAGHVVEVVGLVEEDDAQVTHVIIDDPYGDPRTQYQDPRGNNVEIDEAWFGRVWTGHVHIFRPEGFVLGTREET